MMAKTVVEPLHSVYCSITLTMQVMWMQIEGGGRGIGGLVQFSASLSTRGIFGTGQCMGCNM